MVKDRIYVESSQPPICFTYFVEKGTKLRSRRVVEAIDVSRGDTGDLLEAFC